MEWWSICFAFDPGNGFRWAILPFKFLLNSFTRSDFSTLSAKITTFFWFLLDNVAMRCSYFLKSVSCLFLDSITVGIWAFVACKYVFAGFWFCYRFRIFLSWRRVFPLSHSLFYIKTKFVISTACSIAIIFSDICVTTIRYNGFRNLFQHSIHHYL